MRSNFRWMLAVLGTLLAAASLVSIVQRIGEIELAALPAQYVEFYRNLAGTLVGWIPLPFDWRFPQWYLDLLAISAVCTGAWMRAMYLNGTLRQMDALEWSLAAPLVGLLCLSLWAIPGTLYLITAHLRQAQGEDRSFDVTLLALLATAVAATAVFFLVNAQL